MDIDWQFRILFLILCFIISAFFSGSEVALFSLDRKKIKNTFTNSTLIQHYLNNLLEHPRRLLVTILIGNTVINVTASIIAVSLALELAESFGFSRNIVLTFQIILLTFLILMLSEITPKIWASKDPISFAKIIAIPMYWVNVMIFPISETITEGIKFFASKISIDKKKSAIKHDEIKELATLGLEMGTIEDEEHELIHSIVGFKSLSVSEIMTPRVDMIAVSSDSDFSELVNEITKTGRSRIPLYKDDLDDIIGIIYAKDLLPYFKNAELRKNISLAKIARKPMFVPKTKMIDALMHEFQEKKMHIAIVVDEYGGTAGLVSLEDIIEEIIGEIRDEYDKEENTVTKLDDNNFMVLGRISIDELKEILDININTEEAEYDTIAGLVLNFAGQIPKEGYSFEFENHRFTVKEIMNKRIKKVQIEILLEA
ncbi:MAG: metal transporter [Ignavibacteria bacterium RIFOXYB2_FULL_35_12]|nr:MAG: metal transporter [Ignavibacteria bacterium GWA2_36_19]OGU49299.1 MAG: metal transporter [Ignavibacteria bacterium GWC2_35_8]OGU57949.1 MAG: metal transporter [Ignavibacteria bacterium GWF2_35_20]OGU79497.1 MAG: metal transporter [Ignavibacteria bacterium RIFOXYA2_FULL_35_9]OGU81797.1 MAG: metal transporter [Ignavibacteria bacterium RBG_16_35_7]OGU90478.1 MAG: metal transporter [Ignavibacteria bacterium RIFOXYC12_FULL_35_11]OGU91899.1 MAG: metal transporter [Ignavibacteria bacterium R